MARDDTTPIAPIGDGPALRNRHAGRARCALVAGILASFLTAATYAGDLLRGGAAAGKSNGAAAPAPGTAAATAAQANARDVLARTTQALESVQAMQEAANGLSSHGANNAGLNPQGGGMLPNVPNGLAPGGLAVAPGIPANPSLWQGASLPQQTTKGGQTTVAISQTSPQAILNWQTFNVGLNTTVVFDQDLGGSQTSQWIAFNKVNDPSGLPSQILGSIQANGQVFVINRNGIIFGGSAQVNTHAFYASSLPINGNLISSGLLANPDQQFLFSGLAIPAGPNGTPAFTPDAPYGKDYGDVTVEAGATLTSPTSAASVGGRVVLVGLNVTNAGTIYTPDGQTILAAGRQVGFAAHPSTDATLRGLDAYVGAVTGASGTATNDGLIEAPRGDAMITGRNVNQNGVIDSSTTVTVNGRVDLLADYNATPILNTQSNLYQLTPVSTGTVTFGPGSVTQILPEWSSTATNVGSQLPLPSQVVVEGLVIHMGANAILLAPGAAPPPDPNNAGGTNPALDLAGNAMTSGVNFNAGNWVTVGNTTSIVNNQGQISLDYGAMINVAGSTNVLVPMSQNILSVTLRGTELADSPTQREGVFRGTAIQVDLRNSGVYDGQYWVGTPLANVTGYVGLIQHNVGELTVAGGTVSLNSGGSVLVQSGATINVSGGYVHYTGGMVQTSRLLTTGGDVIDISQATPDQTYDGLYTGRFTTFHDKWGVSDVYSSPLALTGEHYEDAYNQGAGGGTLTITAPTMALDGTLLGYTITGPRQLRSTSTTFPSTSSDASSTSTSSAPPTPSTLKLAFQAQDTTFPAPFPNYSPSPPNLVFQTGITLPPTDAANVDSSYRLLGERATSVVLSPQLLTQDGFGNLIVDNRDGNITIPARVSLQAPPEGSITLYGANIDVEGNVSAPGGSLTFKVYDISSKTLNALKASTNPTASPPSDPTRGNFILGPGASLSTAGLVVDDREGTPDPLTLPIVIDGGSITVNSYNTHLLPGSIIDVSGGVAISPTGKKTYGNGGSITITSGQDLNIPSVLGGKLLLGSVLEGYSAGGGSDSVGTYSGGGNGGSLSIQAPMIQIGGAPTYPDTLDLTPEFFDQGGFGSFTLTALGGRGPGGQYLPAIVIAPGTVIAPVAQAEVASTSAAGVTFIPVNEPLGIRTPVNLTFNAPGISDKYSELALTHGDFVLGAGAAILTDPLGSVTINSETAAILGSIVAPGGTISITTTPSPGFLAQLTNKYPVPNLDLGPHSLLSTAGTVVLLPDPRGYLTGSVLAGGTITVAGNIVAEAGSVLDVSGTSGILDLAPAYSNMSTPLIGALSGQVSAPQTRMPEAPYSGTLITTLPNGTGVVTPYVPSGSFSGAPVVATRVDSNGGSITLTGATELFTDATLRGAAGGPAAVGGTLTISSGVFSPNGITPPLTSPYLTVTQNGPTIPVPFYAPGQTAIGNPVLGANGTPLPGMGYFSANSFMAGGFDNLVLGGTAGTVAFAGPVSITARGSIIVAGGGLLRANSTVVLTAPYVELGMAFQAPISSDQTNQPFVNPISPTYGPGQLTVQAQLIDVGNLSLQNIGQATFNAINGDIRGDGTLDIAGSLILRAGQIYPASAVEFTIVAYTDTANGQVTPGSVTIVGAGTRPLPLSAGGTLNIYATTINQGGTLVAPLGSINLGWNGIGASPMDPITGAGSPNEGSVPIAKQINLTGGSVTSVSAVDPISGLGVTIPYGLNVNGTSWIDPSGTDITADLVPQKSINISGLNVNTQVGSTIDVRGGGDLLSYQFVSGTGGANDILSWNYVGAWTSAKAYSATQIVSYKGSYWYATTASSTESESQPPSVGPYWNQVTPSYAVIPGYKSNIVPFATYNTNPTVTDATNLGVDQGYVNNTLAVGSQIYLGATPGLTAGFYTLLPARYALLPGAFLVTPQSTASVGTFTLTDNSNITAGYRLNDLSQSSAIPELFTTVAVASSEVFNQRATYTLYSANTYLATEAGILGLETPRLPTDAGSLVLSGTTTLAVNGNVYGQGADGGRGAVIDLSTTENILIGGPGGSAPAGTAFLNAALLDSYGAESLLIGGLRQIGSAGTTITVNAGSIEVDNAGAPLVAPEIILVANNGLTLDRGAEVLQAGTIPQGALYPALPILIGNSNVAGSGDGVLLQVSDLTSPVVRSGVDSSTTPTITIGAGATVSGRNVTINSTAGGTLDPTANITGQNINLSAGTISIVLNNPGTLQSNPGIILQGPALNNLLHTSALSLSGYNAIDIYGTGSVTSGNLGLHTGSLRGFTNNPAGVVSIDAASLTLDNAPGQTGLGPAAGVPIQGSFVVNAGTLYTGANTLTIDQYANVALNATNGVVLRNTGGISSQTNLTITTPIIIGAVQASQTITAQNGALNIFTPAGGGNGASLAQTAGLGAVLNLSGSSVEEDSRIYLPSGLINVEATAGNLTVGGTLDVSGTAQQFYDVIEYTSAGAITLTSDLGNVILNPNSTISVAANPVAGNAGTVIISAPNGYLSALGTMKGQGGSGGTNGVFALDANNIDSTGSPDIAALDALLNAADFTQSRTYRVRSGNVVVDGTADALNYTISTDSGDIEITSTGLINAAGPTGGAINLIAWGSVTLDSGAKLTAAGQNFSDAGEGGSVSLEAGSEVNGTPNLAGAVNIASGSIIDLSVASVVGSTGAQTAANSAFAQLYGEFTGTLHIRSPQNAAGTGFAIDPILDGTIVNPSSIVLEGYKVTALTGSGTITSTVQNNVKTNGTTFVTDTTGLYTTLLANNPDVLANDANGTQLKAALSIVPGEEIINTTGDLTLGTASSTSSSDWDLSIFIFGPKSVPGVLTLRAAGDLVFYNALSDGFSKGSGALYLAALTPNNPLLPANAQDWSYNLTAGADFSAANSQVVLPLAQLEAAGAGSLLLGKNYGADAFGTPGANASTSTAISSHYQVIRTGSGNITISAGIDVQLLNEVATIYTAGTIVTPTTSTTMTLPDGSIFDIPILNASGGTAVLGAIQQSTPSPVQYSLGGGNVTITAQGDIAHYTTLNGVEMPDSSKQLPDDWLYRRSYVDASGQFGISPNGEIASTTWWVDFTNFFEGVGALGGGNVTMIAGGNVSNVDGVIPTNARMPIGTPNASKMVELGGGDLVVKAGGNIDGGVYYVESGTGTLDAGNSIITNETRSPSLQILDPSGAYSPPLTWLPTTLFLGGNARNGPGGFNVFANDSVLLGPVSNVFLLPEGYNNTYRYKTYFSTFAATDYVDVTSLSGDVTLRETTTDPNSSASGSVPILQDWIQNIMLLAGDGGTFNSNAASFYQPWLRIDESSTDFLNTALTVQPPSLSVTAFSGSINLQGNITLTPSPTGTINLLAANSINALQPNGITVLPDGTNATVWETATINLSDANPASVFGVTTPFSYQVVASQLAGSSTSLTVIAKEMVSTLVSSPSFFSTFDNLFAESGQTSGSGPSGLDYGSILTQEALRDPTILHANDPNPVRLYTLTGDISGLTLYSGKRAEILASRDITDIGFYIQNVNAQDVSVVSAGRDIIAYDAGSFLRGSNEAAASDNILAADAGPLAGDIQISGPGTLEVLAGRNLNLGNAPVDATANADGIDLGIVSIGNARNPYLPFSGADIITAAGIGGPGDLSNNPNLDIATFVSQFVKTGGSGSSDYLTELGFKSTDISSLPPEQQAAIAIEVFFLVLRDAGRAHTAGTGSYASGFEAISKLFTASTGTGDVSLTSREIETVNGGNIQVLAPNGNVTVGFDVIGQALDQGIITADGGNLNIFANGDVSLGTSRVFTLRGGNIVIWSSTGSIAAGSASKTVKAAPPTRVLIDPGSADVKTDLAGLATGGGIGVLATVAGVAPGDVDLIAPVGVVDAGDAGIRASGNLNIAATKVLNADNIQVSGTSSGTPAVVVPTAPNIGGLASASATQAAASQSANDVTKTQGPQANQPVDQDSTISVEVVGYGGGDTSPAPADNNQ